MSKLLLRPKIVEGQCRQDYLMSLSDANSLRGPNDLARRFKTSFSVLINIPITDLYSLISGNEVRNLGYLASTTKSPTSFLYGWKSEISRICPDCLLANNLISSEFNSILSLSCLIHKLELIDKCSQCSRNLLYTRFARNFCNCGFDLRKSHRLQAEEWPTLFYSVFAPWKLNSDIQFQADYNFTNEYHAGQILMAYWNLRKQQNWRVVSSIHGVIKKLTSNGWDSMQQNMIKNFRSGLMSLSVLELQGSVLLPRIRDTLMLAYPWIISFADKTLPNGRFYTSKYDRIFYDQDCELSKYFPSWLVFSQK